MVQRENTRLAIIGAGAVGASIAYATLIRGSARHIRLYDVNAARAEAEVLDLAHGSQFTSTSDVDGGADLAHVDGADVVVITAGAKQKPGQSRIELAGTNVELLRGLMPQLVQRAPHAIYIVVSNPCDVLTVAARQASGLPVNQVFSSGTVLDTARLRWLLAQRAGVARSNVHADVVGEHGDTEFPLWSTATIGSTPVLDWQRDGVEVFKQRELEEIGEQVRTAAYKVIEGKGATSYAIGLSTARIVEALLQDEGAVLPVSTVMQDFRGLSDVALSVPCVVSAQGAVPVLTTPLSAVESDQLHASAEALRAVQRSLGLPC